MYQIQVELIKSVDYVAKKMFHDIMFEKIWQFMRVYGCQYAFWWDNISFQWHVEYVQLKNLG